jgi:hypothetical protein
MPHPSRLATLIWLVAMPSGAWAQEQTPDGEKIETLRHRLGQASVLRVTRIRMLQSPAVTADGLLVGTRTPADSTPGLIPWSQVGRVRTEVSLAGRGALIGGILGAGALGGLAGAISSQVGPRPSNEASAGLVAIGAVIGGAAGAGLGALVTSSGKRWTDAYRGPRPPSLSRRSNLVSLISKRRAAVFTAVEISEPDLGVEGVAGSLTSSTHSDSERVLMRWSEIHRVESRGGNPMPATLIGACIGAAAALAFTSTVYLETPQDTYLVIGCSLTGALSGWSLSSNHGGWSKAYQGKLVPGP